MMTTKTTRRPAPARAPAPKPSTPQSEGSPSSEIGAADESADAASRSKDKAALSLKPARQLHLHRSVLERTLVPNVVVPSHHEEQHIVACPGSLQQAARYASRAGANAPIAVAPCAFTDSTATVCKRRGVAPVETHASNVGIVRVAGARWLVFTDAGSVVAPDVLSALAPRRLFGRCA